MDKTDAIIKIKEQLLYNREHKKEILIEHLNNMKMFTDDFIEQPPITDPETYKNVVIPNFIRCGAIPKHKLITGKIYFGDCRNADKAIWNGKQFEYMRTKFGTTYKETINHFEDDDGYDLFVPIRQLD